MITGLPGTNQARGGGKLQNPRERTDAAEARYD